MKRTEAKDEELDERDRRGKNSADSTSSPWSCSRPVNRGSRAPSPSPSPPSVCPVYQHCSAGWAAQGVVAAALLDLAWQRGGSNLYYSLILPLPGSFLASRKWGGCRLSQHSHPGCEGKREGTKARLASLINYGWGTAGVVRHLGLTEPQVSPSAHALYPEAALSCV